MLKNERFKIAWDSFKLGMTISPGLFNSRGAIKFSKSMSKSTKILLQRATTEMDQNKIGISGAWMSSDRGRNDNQF